MLKLLVHRGLMGAVFVLIGIQLIPYGRKHTNLPVIVEPLWDTQKTRELAVRACFDCHSNQTAWPWYSYIAPISWLVQQDVDQGREKLNYSEWNRPQEHARQLAKMVREKRMPQWYYAAIHPQANLSSHETQALIRGLVATFGEEEEHGKEKDNH